MGPQRHLDQLLYERNVHRMTLTPPNRAELWRDTSEHIGQTTIEAVFRLFVPGRPSVMVRVKTAESTVHTSASGEGTLTRAEASMFFHSSGWVPFSVLEHKQAQGKTAEEATDELLERAGLVWYGTGEIAVEAAGGKTAA